MGSVSIICLYIYCLQPHIVIRIPLSDDRASWQQLSIMSRWQKESGRMEVCRSFTFSLYFIHTSWLHSSCTHLFVRGKLGLSNTNLGQVGLSTLLSRSHSGPVHTRSHVPSLLRSIRAILAVESLEVGTHHFTHAPKSQVPSPKLILAVGSMEVGTHHFT